MLLLFISRGQDQFMGLGQCWPIQYVINIYCQPKHCDYYLFISARVGRPRIYNIYIIEAVSDGWWVIITFEWAH